MALALIVDDLRVFLVSVVSARTGGVLQFRNCIGGPHVFFTTGTPGVFTTRIQGTSQHGVWAECGLVYANGFLGHFEHANAFHLGGGACKVGIYKGLVQTNGFENLRAGVAHVGGNAHLGHHFHQALAHRLDVVVHGFFRAQVARQAFAHFGNGFHGQVRVHRFRTVTSQQGKVVGFTGRPSFNHQAGGGAQAHFHQVLVNGRHGQQCRNSHVVTAHHAVGDDQNVHTLFHGIAGFGTQGSDTRFNAFLAPSDGIANIQFMAGEFATSEGFNVANLRHVFRSQHGL